MPQPRRLVAAVRLALTLLLAVGLLACSSPGASAHDWLDEAAVDRWVTEYLDAEGSPGAAVAVVHDGQVIVETGDGTKDVPITARRRRCRSAR